MKIDDLARALLRVAFRGRTIRRRLPRSVGGAVVFVAPDSQLKYLKPGSGGLDAGLIGWARRYVGAGDVIWDIGANSGIFSMAAAGMGADVLAVEPDPFLADALIRTALANPKLRLEVLAGAIDETSGIATLEIASGGRASNALRAYAGNYLPFGRSLGHVLVPTVRLDDLLAISTPHLVKIDIEGAEIAALRGGASLLADVRPVILLEIGSEVWAESREIFTAARYRLFDPEHPDRQVTEPMFNILARPD